MISDSGGVFNVTAFDPNAVQRADERYTEPKVYRSISDITPSSDLQIPFIFTEKETNKAMMMVGATPDDLVRMSEIDKKKIPGTPLIRQRIIDDLEGRRLKTFAAIVQARDTILTQTVTNKKRSRKSINALSNNSNDTRKNVNFDKLKRKQINNLINYQQKKEQQMKLEEVAAQRLEEQRKQRNSSIERKKYENLQNLRRHLFSLSKRPNIDESIGKLEKEREEERAKENSELSQLELDFSKLTKKPQKANKKEEIDALKKRIEQNDRDFLQKIEKLRGSQNFSSSSQYSSDDRSSSSQNSGHHINLAHDHKKYEEEKAMILKERENQLEERKKQLTKQIQAKEKKIEENLKLISSQKLRQIKKHSMQLRRRSQSAANTKKILEEQKLERIAKMMQRQNEALERAKLLKASKTNEVMEKAGEKWIRHRNGFVNAKKERIQKQFKIFEKVEKTMEIQMELKEEEEMLKKKNIREFRNRTIMKVKQREEYEELRSAIQMDPDADPKELAVRYHVDIPLYKPLPKNSDSVE